MKSSESSYRLRAWKRTKNKALGGKLDAEIYELKTDLQSMVDRLKLKECQLNFIQLAPPETCVPVPIQKKSMGTNTDSSSRKVSDVSTQRSAPNRKGLVPSVTSLQLKNHNILQKKETKTYRSQTLCLDDSSSSSFDKENTTNCQYFLVVSVFQVQVLNNEMGEEVMPSLFLASLAQHSLTCPCAS